MSHAPREPLQGTLSIEQLEVLAADLPDEFPGAGLLQDGELLAYLLTWRRLLDGTGIRARGVVHLGANVGEELGVYLLLGFADVLMIEANPAAIPALTRNVAAINGVAARFDEPMRLAPASRARALHCAVGAAAGEVTLHVTDVPTLSSLMRPLLDADEVPCFAVVEEARVAMRRLDEILADTPGEFNALRLNIQGSELLALEGAGRWLAQCQLIYCEVNLAERYAGCPRIDEIDAFLGARGFVRKWGHQWSPTGGDAVYVRR